MNKNKLRFLWGINFSEIQSGMKERSRKVPVILMQYMQYNN